MQTAYDLQRQQMTSLIVRRVSNSGADNYLVSQTYNYKDAANGNKNNGRLIQVSDYMDASYSATYGYDDYNRLSSATASAYSRTYGYDAWGNLLTLNTGGTTSETGNYTLNYALVGGTNNAPATNRISGNGSDEVGNLTQEGGWTYTYDAANRLKTAGGSSNSYDYDGDGHKVKQMTGEYGPVYYLWSSVLNQPVLELTSGGVYRAYVYGPSGGLLALQSSDANFYWVHSDHLGSGRKLSDASGAMVYRGEYDPHGQMLYEWASSGATFLNSKKFTGYERNWATNLDDANARSYHHNRARFMQPDPLGVGASDLANPQSLNLYAYVGNDPINFIDPSGLNAQNPGDGCSTGSHGTSVDGIIGNDGKCYETVSGTSVTIHGGGSGNIVIIVGQISTSRGGDSGGASGGRGQAAKKEDKPPCQIDGAFSASQGFTSPIGGFSASELNDATITVFGEISSRVSDNLFNEALAVASEIFNRSDAILSGTQGRNPFGATSNLTDVVSAGNGVQFAGFNQGKDTIRSGTDFYQGERNCVRFLVAASAVAANADFLTKHLYRKPFLFNRANSGGGRKIQTGQVRIGGNDFSRFPM